MSRTIDHVRFDVLRNCLYHTARRRVLEGRRRMLDLLVVLFGTATVADMAAFVDVGHLLLGGATATIGALQLVFDFGGRARTHEMLQRDYYKLLADIERQPEPDAAAVAGWNAELIRISGEEPPTLRAADAVAYNETADILSEETSDRLVISWWQRLTRNWLAHDGARFDRIGEIEARRKPGTAEDAHEAAPAA